MKISFKTRGLVVGIAFGALLVASPAVPASAAKLKPSVVCSKLVEPPLNKTNNQLKSTLSQCTPAALKAGGVSVVTIKDPNATIKTLKVTITWKNGKGKTVSSYVLSTPKGNGKCPKGTGRVGVGGKVTGGTGAAAKIIKKGEPISASICAYQSGPKLGQASLEPGTKFKL